MRAQVCRVVFRAHNVQAKCALRAPTLVSIGIYAGTTSEGTSPTSRDEVQVVGGHYCGLRRAR